VIISTGTTETFGRAMLQSHFARLQRQARLFSIARSCFRGRVPLFSLREPSAGQRYQIGDRISTGFEKQIRLEISPFSMVRSDSMAKREIAFAIKDASDPLCLWPTCLISRIGTMETFGGAMLQYSLDRLKPRLLPPRPLGPPRRLLRSSFASPLAILSEQIPMRSLIIW